MRLVLSLSDSTQRTSVERAIAEFRMARPVLIQRDGAAALAMGVDDLAPEGCGCLESIAGGQARLVLTSARLRRLGLDRPGAGAIALPSIDAARIRLLALTTQARVDAPVRAAVDLDEDALELARLALTVPAAVVVPVGRSVEIDPSVLSVTGPAVRAYREAAAHDLRIVGRAPVPLDGAPDSEFVVFRGGEGLRDQVAIVVGRPDPASIVSVRLHSACLTGDLFGSLKCDCGDQLRGTARWMAGNGGGILLYLDQEGRGTGIANKIRAYELQAQGYDTYDADEVLGFGPDQRRFDFAAEMLKRLGVGRVHLITNNPDKIAALRRGGVDVVSDSRAVGRPTPENLRYLSAKRDRAGHLIDMETMPRLREQD
jgi:GTP cyclohydrolase II